MHSISCRYKQIIIISDNIENRSPSAVMHDKSKENGHELLMKYVAEDTNITPSNQKNVRVVYKNRYTTKTGVSWKQLEPINIQSKRCQIVFKK